MPSIRCDVSSSSPLCFNSPRASAIPPAESSSLLLGPDASGEPPDDKFQEQRRREDYAWIASLLSYQALGELENLQCPGKPRAITLKSLVKGVNQPGGQRPFRTDERLRLGSNAETFLGQRAPLGTTDLNPRVWEAVAAARAVSGSLILEQLDGYPALGAWNLEDCVGFPVSSILARALHPFHLSDSMMCAFSGSLGYLPQKSREKRLTTHHHYFNVTPNWIPPRMKPPGDDIHQYLHNA